MGGYGSGRYSPTGRQKVEHCRSIDVNKMNREGCLANGASGKWGWWDGSELIANINFYVCDDAVRFVYRTRFDGGDWIDVEYSIPIYRVACRYGGTRPYFICPGVKHGKACRRRVTKLYSRGRYFLCRHCQNLAYASQGEAALDRLIRKTNKARRKISTGGGSIPSRPKGMWSRKYERLLEDLIDLENEADGLFLDESMRRFGWRI